MKGRLRDRRAKRPLVVLIGELEERQRAAIRQAKEAVTIRAHLPEQLVGFAPGRHQRQPNHLLVERAGLLHVLGGIGGMMQTAGELCVVTMLAFLPCQRASRDGGSHDGGAAGEPLACAEDGAAAQTFSPVVGASINRSERAHARPARIRVPAGTIVTRLVQVLRPTTKLTCPARSVSHESRKTYIRAGSGTTPGSDYLARLRPADEIHLGAELGPEVDVGGVTQLRQVVLELRLQPLMQLVAVDDQLAAIVALNACLI